MSFIAYCTAQLLHSADTVTLKYLLYFYNIVVLLYTTPKLHKPQGGPMSAYNTLPTQDKAAQVAQALRERGFRVEHVDSGKQALESLKSLLPEKAEVMVGSSTTLNQIGFSDYLQSGQHSWRNLNAEIWAENDDQKRAELRRYATTAEYVVASVNAITEEGQLIAVDATGSRVGTYPFGAQHLILVVGTQKITKDLQDGMQRVREYVFPKEDVRAQAAYGVGSTMAKWVILERETTPDRTTVILVDEKLGY